MTGEARVQPAEHGLVPAGDGWHVLNARAAAWRHVEGRSAVCELEGEPGFAQAGVSLFVLRPGEAMAMYHWEVDQEDFLVLAGEALLVVEGEERPLRGWDLFHCPAGTKHVLVGAGSGPSVVLAVGARDHAGSAGWGGYTIDEAAGRHGASVEQDTTDEWKAYERLTHRRPTRYREGWRPG